MKRPWQVWLVFVVCVLGAAGAMVWLTQQALRGRSRAAGGGGGGGARAAGEPGAVADGYGAGADHGGGSDSAAERRFGRRRCDGGRPAAVCAAAVRGAAATRAWQSPQVPVAASRTWLPQLARAVARRSTLPAAVAASCRDAPLPTAADVATLAASIGAAPTLPNAPNQHGDESADRPMQSTDEDPFQFFEGNRGNEPSQTRQTATTQQTTGRATGQQAQASRTAIEGGRLSSSAASDTKRAAQQSLMQLQQREVGRREQLSNRSRRNPATV